MKGTSKRIGIFDSGVGGVTVLKELYRQLPHESVLYFADTARLPYGEKTPAQIQQYVVEILHWLRQQNVKMIIMACNTSSALALQTAWTDFELPVLGLILPGAREAASCGDRIGVIATPATAASGAYGRAIKEVNPTAEVWEIGCPEFVPLIEANRFSDPYTHQVAQTYLAPLLEAKIDTLIYGCSHYRHLEPLLQSILPPEIQYIDPAESTVSAAQRELELAGLINISSNHLPTQFCVSANPEVFAQQVHQHLAIRPTVRLINLPTVTPVGTHLTQTTS
ncbi:MAG: glutamate racemase [Cyanobacteria bacterium P01_H01_bin.15]